MFNCNHRRHVIILGVREGGRGEGREGGRQGGRESGRGGGRE